MFGAGLGPFVPVLMASLGEHKVCMLLCECRYTGNCILYANKLLRNTSSLESSFWIHYTQDMERT